MFVRPGAAAAIAAAHDYSRIAGLPVRR